MLQSAGPTVGPALGPHDAPRAAPQVAPRAAHAAAFAPGSLADADLPREVARLAALRTHQNVGDAAPAGGVVVPQTLLSLFLRVQ